MRVRSAHLCVFVRLVVPSVLHGIHRGTEPLSQSVFYSTFPQPAASVIALWMQLHGHKRGIIGETTPVCLSPEGANC